MRTVSGEVAEQPEHPPAQYEANDFRDSVTQFGDVHLSFIATPDNPADGTFIGRGLTVLEIAQTRDVLAGLRARKRRMSDAARQHEVGVQKLTRYS